ncbi:MAG: hypothetical protein H0U74_22155 [Bradymonadaceae bacterium]|nr:hypothetical protein [Lujinxingiaceae bacterium]
MPKIPRIISRTALLVALFGVTAGGVLLAPGALYAQDIDARLEAMLVQAADDYDMLMLEDAETKLEEAVALARRQKASPAVTARVLIMLGVVRYANTRDEGLTEDAFVQALEVDFKVELDRVYQTPTLNQIYDRAKRRAKPPADQSQVVVEPKEVKAAEGQLQHTAIRRAPSGEHLLIEVFVPETMPVFRIHVHHRRFGEEGFVRGEMLPTSTTRFALSIEAKDVRTSQLEYYVEAVDRAGNALANSGRAQSPHTVIVLGSGGTDLMGDPIEPDPVVDAPSEGIGFYGMLAIGTDLGFLPGGTSPTANRHREVAPGIAPAFAHILLDLGVMITPSAHLGLYMRWQFSPDQQFSLLPAEAINEGSGFWDTEEECLGTGLMGDCQLGLKYRWVFSTGKPEFYSSVGGGIGRIRNWLRLKELASNPLCDGKELFDNGEYCYVRDTVRTGWAHFGIGGGLNFPMTDFLDLTADTYLMFLVPDTSINLDINFGLRFKM